MRIHYNKLNGIFSVRREDRSTVCATERHGKLPRFGDTFELSPSVHILVTRKNYIEAMTKSRPFADVRVTKWPRLRLALKVIREVF